MTSTLVHNIGQLVTNDPQHDGTKLGVIENAALLIEDGVVAWVGPESDAPTHHIKHRVDARGRAVIPGFVDSHTHMIFAGDRSKEFRARMLGEVIVLAALLTQCRKLEMQVMMYCVLTRKHC